MYYVIPTQDLYVKWTPFVLGIKDTMVYIAVEAITSSHCDSTDLRESASELVELLCHEHGHDLFDGDDGELYLYQTLSAIGELYQRIFTTYLKSMELEGAFLSGLCFHNWTGRDIVVWAEFTRISNLLPTTSII